MGRRMGLLHLIYADDGWLAATGRKFWKKVLMWLFIYELFEIPITWKKVKGGAEVDWIGYHLNISTFERGVNESKKQWIKKWIDERLEHGGVVGRELKSALGRMQKGDGKSKGMKGKGGKDGKGKEDKGKGKGKGKPFGGKPDGKGKASKEQKGKGKGVGDTYWTCGRPGHHLKDCWRVRQIEAPSKPFRRVMQSGHNLSVDNLEHY